MARPMRSQEDGSSPRGGPEVLAEDAQFQEEQEWADSIKEKTRARWEDNQKEALLRREEKDVE